MTVSSIIASTTPIPATIETRGSWAVCLTALGIAAVSFAAPAITVVGLKSIAADLGGERSVPALAYSLAWLGASFGGVAMGRPPSVSACAHCDFRVADDRVGSGCWRKAAALSLLLGYGLFIGLLGNAGDQCAALYLRITLVRPAPRHGSGLARQRLVGVRGDLGADFRGRGGA